MKQQRQYSRHYLHGIACQKYTLWLYLLLFARCFMQTAVVYADGGAPNLAYVASAGGSISVIDVAQQKVVKKISSISNPRALLLSVDGQYLYTSQPQQGRVTMLAANTGNVICTTTLPGQPAFLALDTSTTSLYVASHSAAAITVLDATSCRVKRTIHTQAPLMALPSPLQT